MGWLDAALRRGSGGAGLTVAVTLSDWFPGVPAAGAGKLGAGLPVICRSGSAARLPRVMIQVLTRKPSREDPLDRAPAFIMAY
jgi:hypothetical protein